MEIKLSKEMKEYIYEIFVNGYDKEYFKSTKLNYLKEVSANLEEWKKCNEFSEEQLYRLTIVYIFEDYRVACDHGILHTDINKINCVRSHPAYYEKMAKYNIINMLRGRFITSINEYRNELGVEHGRDFGRDEDLRGKKFFEFIINGTPMKDTSE